MKKLTLLNISAVALVLGSCSDSKFDGYTRAENGLHYKFYNHDESATTIQKGDGFVFRYIITNQRNDSVIVDSKNSSQDGSGYVRYMIDESTFKGSFEDGLLMMAKGDSAEFIIPADSFFLKTMRQNELPLGINPGDHLKGVFSIKEIRTKKELEENQKQQMAEQKAREAEMSEKQDAEIAKYLADKKMKVQPTASGLYYMEVKKGNGPKPGPTDIVKVKYRGTLLDGTEFDNSEKHGGTVEFAVNEVVPGWTEALMMMNKGGKAKLVLPFQIGYGSRGGGPIPPYSPLAFELELLDVTQGAPENGPMAPGQ